MVEELDSIARMFFEKKIYFVRANPKDPAQA